MSTHAHSSPDGDDLLLTLRTHGLDVLAVDPESWPGVKADVSGDGDEILLDLTPAADLDTSAKGAM